MSMSILPSEILSNILCMTNDATIYALANTCKAMNSTLHKIKHELTWRKYNTRNYNFYNVIPDCVFLKHGRNMEESCSLPLTSFEKETHNFSMYLFTIMLLHKVDGVNDFDVITSIKIKGDVNMLSLIIGQDVRMSLNINAHLANNILTKDNEGYIEVLTPFLDIVPTYCLHAINAAFLSIQSSGGDVVIDITKAKLINKPKQQLIHCKTPHIFYTKCYDDIVPLKLMIPVSCTWNDEIACIYFNKPMENIIDYIELVDMKCNSMYKISSKRLEANFVQRNTSKYKWLNIVLPQMAYIVPLLKNGGMYNILFSLKKDVTYLKVSGAKWQEEFVVYPESVQE